jgi:hypothetical protein
MNGAEFLARARESAPDTVRMLLTGHADLSAAIDAINHGHIFQFLTKPCEKDVLVYAIRSALAQYRASVAEKDILKKIQQVGGSRSDWDTADHGGNFEDPASIPGPLQAKTHLEKLVGVDPQCYVVLFKLTLLHTVEERYGEEASGGYLDGMVQLLAQALRPDEQLFHWSTGVLMALVRRQISSPALRMEFSRFLGAMPQHIVDIHGKKTMIAMSTTFELLPACEFSTLEEMLSAIDAKLMAKT